MSTVQADVGRQGKVVVAAVIVGVAAVGYVAATWLASDTQKKSHVSAVQTTAPGTPTSESEHYAQVLDRYNKEKASTAEQTGSSYLSVLSSRANDVPEQGGTTAQPQPQTQEAPSPTFPQQVSQVPAYQQPPAQQNWRQDPQFAKQVEEHTQGLMANWSTEPHSIARVSTDAAEYGKSISVAEMGSQGRQAVGALPAVKVIEDFALVPALLETDIDTDENSLVRAHFPSGPYAGADVYALGYRRLTNTVDMTFTFMKWKGRSYKITAKAVDQVSMRTSLSGEVNNRYFSRIILPAIAMGIGRTGQLYEQANAQNIITPQGGIIQTRPEKPSGSAVAGTIVGGMGNQAGQVLANDAANMPVKQVLIPRKTTIGIQFIGPVLSSDDTAAGVAAAPQQGQAGADALSVLGQPAGQPPRQSTPSGPQEFPGNPAGYAMPGTGPQPAMRTGIPGYSQ